MIPFGPEPSKLTLGIYMSTRQHVAAGRARLTKHPRSLDNQNRALDTATGGRAAAIKQCCAPRTNASTIT